MATNVPTIFDYVTAPEIAAYYTALPQDRRPYLGDELFPARKQLGLDLKWLKGARGIPVILKNSAFDVPAVPRDRLGFKSLSDQMPFFKESMSIDETMRQQLNSVLQTGNTNLIDMVINKIFDDSITLLDAAAATRERMRMSLLSSGVISIENNGQNYYYDYNLSSDQKPTATKSWSDITADIISEIKSWQDIAEDGTGIRPTRAILSRKTLGYILKNTAINKMLWPIIGGAGYVSEAMVKRYFLDELNVTLAVYSKRYRDESGNTVKFFPDDVFTLIPEGDLGSTFFGTTPEESDLLTSGVANVAIVDMGVAVTTIKKADPVNVEEKVSMVSLPSFEAADAVVVGDVIA